MISAKQRRINEIIEDIPSEKYKKIVGDYDRFDGKYVFTGRIRKESPEVIVAIWKKEKYIEKSFVPKIADEDKLDVIAPKIKTQPKHSYSPKKSRSYSTIDSTLMLKPKTPLTDVEIAETLKTMSPARYNKVVALYKKGCNAVNTLSISTGEDKGLVAKIMENPEFR